MSNEESSAGAEDRLTDEGSRPAFTPAEEAQLRAELDPERRAALMAEFKARHGQGS